jgi:hypothetical protein
MTVAHSRRISQDEREILDSLDHEVYMFAYRLYQLKPLSVPLAIYVPEENPPSCSGDSIASAKFFPAVTVKQVPGDHRGCVARHAVALVAKMKKALA